MIRSSQSAHDPLIPILKQSCYGDHAEAIAFLFRNMVASYHVHNSEEEERQAAALSEQVFAAIPTAYKITTVGMFNVYKMINKDISYRCIWRDLLAKGSYNQVYYADLIVTSEKENTIPAVVKVTVESDKDLRVYLLENVLHALLVQMVTLRDFIVPIRFPFKIQRRGFPKWVLGTVMDDPGKGTLGDWLCDSMHCDQSMFVMFTQIVWILHQMQTAVRFAHRDLKCDNIMLRATAASQLTVHVADSQYTVPTMGLACLLIDFGMARLEWHGEYIACDCYDTNTKFNPAQDLQNLCCTLLEDYEKELDNHAPQFKKFIKELCAPLFHKVKQIWPTYDTLSTNKRNERLSKVIRMVKIAGFVPAQMLRTLHTHFK